MCHVNLILHISYKVEEGIVRLRYDKMDHQRMNLIEKLFTFYELNINFENDRMTYIPK